MNVAERTRREASPAGAALPHVTIVIVNWNGRDLTLRCLDSLARLSYPSFDVVVVDNGSTDGSVDALAARDDVTVIAGRSNVGYARATNRALSRATAPYVLLLNNDTVIDDPSVLERAVRFLEEHGRAAAVGVRLRNEDGTTQVSIGRFHSLATEARHTIPWRVVAGRPTDRPWYEPRDHLITRQVDWVVGAFLLVRTSALAAIGFLDERRFLYGEDYDVCFRLRRAGWEVWFLADASVTHVGNATAGRVYTPAERSARIFRSERSLLERHRGPAYAWTFALFVLADRASKAAVAALLGDRRRRQALLAEVRARLRALVLP